MRILDASRSESVALSDRLGHFEAIGIATGRAIVTAETDGMRAVMEVNIDPLRTPSVEVVMRRKAEQPVTP